MDSCMVGHKRGSRQWPGFTILCFGSFQQQFGATSREIGAWLLVRPKYPVLPGLREGRTSCGRLHPAPGCLSRQHF